MRCSRARVGVAVTVAASLVAIAACGRDTSTDPADGTASDRSGRRVAGTVTVLAAASLGAVFDALVPEFRAQHPAATVTVQLGGSSALARQVADGAPADVLVTADAASMEMAAAHVGDPVRFAANRLAIVVESGNPARITGLADLANPAVKTVLCAPAVPCGRLAAAALERAGIDLRPASLEPDVRGVVAKVELGEADAGVAYATDVRAAGDAVEAVVLPDDEDLRAEYLAAVVDETVNRQAAEAWVAFLTSPAAAAVLRSHGLLVP